MQLIYEKLPNDISDRHVLFLDPILGTGLSVLKIDNVIHYHANLLLLWECTSTDAYMKYVFLLRTYMMDLGLSPLI